MECHFRAIDFMIGSVINSSVNANHRISAEGAGLHGLLNTFSDRRDIFLRNRAADDRGVKLIELLSVRIHRFELHFAVAILSTAAGLLYILVLLIHRFGEGFLVSNLRCTDIRLDMELTKQTVHDDLKVQLAHAGNDGLPGLLVCVCAERRIFLREFLQRIHQFGLSGLCLRLDRELNDRIRELHGLENDRMVLIAERVSG